jgi:aminopeptidase YwaD
VVYNNAQGIVRGTLQELGAIPAVIIDRPSGEKLRDRLSSGPLRVRLVVKSVSERRTSYNVVARWPGAEGHKVVVGGHYDSVAEGPGANDNASGVAIVLELARLSAHTEVGRQTLFVAFGAEELGLFGSRHFAAGLVGSQIEALSAMMNLDMVGVGDRMIAVGDAKMTELSRWFGLEVGQNVVVNSQPGGSDHAPFARRGVRVLFLTRPDDTNYHTARDTFDNIQPKLLELAGQIAELVLKHLIMVGDEALLYGWSGKGSQVVLSPEDNPKSM